LKVVEDPETFSKENTASLEFDEEILFHSVEKDIDNNNKVTIMIAPYLK